MKYSSLKNIIKLSLKLLIQSSKYTIILIINLFHLKMTDCFSEVERSQEVIVWNSGKFVTQLGLFDDCLSNSSLKYGLLDMFNKTTHKPLGVMMGTCLPNICNDQ